MGIIYLMILNRMSEEFLKSRNFTFKYSSYGLLFIIQRNSYVLWNVNKKLNIRTT